MKTKSKEPIKEHFKIRVFILMAIIVLYISIRKRLCKLWQTTFCICKWNPITLNSSERDVINQKKRNKYFCCGFNYKITIIKCALYLRASCVKIRVINAMLFQIKSYLKFLWHSKMSMPCTPLSYSLWLLNVLRSQTKPGTKF
jgi:hypothetical protein